MKSLYPSLKCDQCETAVKDIIMSSNIKVQGVNCKELAIFIRKHLSTKEINEKGFAHLIPEKMKSKDIREKLREKNLKETNRKIGSKVNTMIQSTKL